MTIEQISDKVDLKLPFLTKYEKEQLVDKILMLAGLPTFGMRNKVDYIIDSVYTCNIDNILQCKTLEDVIKMNSIK